MSRNIDISDASKLSDEDKRYLQDRNRLPEGVEPVEAGIGYLEEERTVNLAGSHLEGYGDDSEYGELKVAELKEKLEELGLPTSGNKGELIKRLEEAESEDDDDEDDEDEDEDEEE